MNFTRQLAILICLAVLSPGPVEASAQSPETWAAAVQDRQQFDPREFGWLYYVTTDNLPPAKQLTAGRTTAFATSSFSRAVVLEHHLPAPVAHGLWRIDLRGLQWSASDWHKVLARYPYKPDKWPPLVIRGDWLTVELSDQHESDAGYRLLYGSSRIPQTLTDFRNFWQVGKGDPGLALFQVIDDSGVSILRTRWIENSDTPNRGFYYGTQDNSRANFNANTDPLESLLNQNRPHDASEHIVGFAKLSIAQGAGGTAQAYLLANGAGKRQDRAPVDIVEDHTRFRGIAEIRNSGSCIQCHVEGIRPLPENDLRELIRDGVDLYADKQSQQLIEQQYLAETRLKVEIARHQDDYSAFVALCTGWGPVENARAFRDLVDDYDAPLDLEAAAREVYMAPEEFKLALGYASARNVKLGARLAGLAHGRTVERSYWESAYKTAYATAELWRQAKR